MVNIDIYDMDSLWSAFSLCKLAANNTRVDMSPNGQNVFADAIQTVNLILDALMNGANLAQDKDLHLRHRVRAAGEQMLPTAHLIVDMRMVGYGYAFSDNATMP